MPSGALSDLTFLLRNFKVRMISKPECDLSRWSHYISCNKFLFHLGMIPDLIQCHTESQDRSKKLDLIRGR